MLPTSNNDNTPNGNQGCTLPNRPATGGPNKTPVFQRNEKRTTTTTTISTTNDEAVHNGTLKPVPSTVQTPAVAQPRTQRNAYRRNAHGGTSNVDVVGLHDQRKTTAVGKRRGDALHNAGNNHRDKTRRVVLRCRRTQRGGGNAKQRKDDDAGGQKAHHTPHQQWTAWAVLVHYGTGTRVDEYLRDGFGGKGQRQGEGVGEGGVFEHNGQDWDDHGQE